jgi:diadenosine tetraphosphate (Ap4A) HIT family hydrolase
MRRCVFCEILTGRSPSSVVFEDDVCCALMDIQPVNPGHVLVIPNRHAASLAELDPESGAHMFKVAQRVARALKESGLRCEGVNFFLADGEAAGQDVFHAGVRQPAAEGRARRGRRYDPRCVVNAKGYSEDKRKGAKGIAFNGWGNHDRA